MNKTHRGQLLHHIAQLGLSPVAPHGILHPAKVEIRSALMATPVDRPCSQPSCAFLLWARSAATTVNKLRNHTISSSAPGDARSQGGAAADSIRLRLAGLMSESCSANGSAPVAPTGAEPARRMAGRGGEGVFVLLPSLL
ncbi:hypothetical protein AAFF_G00416310 [Aldrovandia affinis]|uniref:Uncharacterized protein n=1 Tax=Aldrovandia affinis TaxID=143900 RepID=A0AAD7SAJ1_9TELE|nr:hypothetical protein AAFF_G00416310 [Aldrovandia affinis]